jgi:hypothetical protein
MILLLLLRTPFRCTGRVAVGKELGIKTLSDELKLKWSSLVFGAINQRALDLTHGALDLAIRLAQDYNIDFAGKMRNPRQRRGIPGLIAFFPIFLPRIFPGTWPWLLCVVISP